jgi:hypothetical protein
MIWTNVCLAIVGASGTSTLALTGHPTLAFIALLSAIASIMSRNSVKLS